MFFYGQIIHTIFQFFSGQALKTHSKIGEETKKVTGVICRIIFGVRNIFLGRFQYGIQYAAV
ncbi:hypothetical protein DCCM_3136 [Desulfocucumis palustris]|uniref:Uncharacterized protein n=1 Tax=Desulfocucumis palustris TaxID=1898651 RepID=A0A2L2XCS1_9FIRM|nr:hypothetical protein DCCM_3136 [Desulfocucumis palustris]